MSDAPETPASYQLWAVAELARRLSAVDPLAFGGVWLRAHAGPVRERWLDSFRQSLEPTIPWRRLPIGIPDDRLLGGLDLVATLEAHRPVLQRGVLSECDGGILIAPMAERLERSTVGRLAAALDDGEIRMEREGLSALLPARFALVALDEGDSAEETLAGGLRDRLAFHLDLRTVPPREAVLTDEADVDLDAARALLATMQPPEGTIEALCGLASALGVASLRAPLFALKASLAHAALFGRETPDDSDIAAAASLVLAPRATRIPAPPDEEEAETPQPPPPDQPAENEEPKPETTAESLAEMLVDTAIGSLPAELLEQLRDPAPRSKAVSMPGQAGANRKAALRGRQIGNRPGDPRRGRLDLVATLRAAAPWQPLRHREMQEIGPRIAVRRDDFRIKRLRQKTGSLAIFAVDASGSAALNRLGEAKGAVERLLSDCYVRREEVAVVAFRGTGAELLLPPTRSLTRAKRNLAGLPGGGGTPLAAGIRAALSEAEAAVRRGQTPVLVVLTDGRANIALDGTPGRPQAGADALAMAEQVAIGGMNAVVVDMSPRPSPQAKDLAARMRARYLPLPHTDPERVTAVVRDTART